MAGVEAGDSSRRRQRVFTSGAMRMGTPVGDRCRSIVAASH